MHSVNMYACVVKSFVLITTVISQVEILPSGTFVSAPGQDLTFQCSPLGGESFTNVEWLLNGSRIENFNLTNIETDFFPNVNLGILILKSLTTAAFNSSHIRCIATLASGSGPLSSSATLLLLQGPLSSVMDLMLHLNNTFETVIITWRPPVSLNVMNVSNDDLTYCINVTNATSLEPLQTECNVTDAEFEFSLPPMSWCGVIAFTIKPINLAGRGPPSETVYVPELNTPKIDGVLCALIAINITRIYSYTLSMTSPVCSVMAFIFNDSSMPIHPNLTVARNFITFTSQQLDLDRVYDVRVRAENFGGFSTSQTRIRTNDVTAVEMRVAGDKLDFQVTYCENSDAGGVLVCLLFITEDETVDFSKSPLQALDRTQSSNHTIVFDYDGEYMMLVYNILRDGTLASGTSSPAMTDTLSVNGTDNAVGPTLRTSIQCSANASYLFILVKCTNAVTGIQVTAQMVDVSTEVVSVGTLYTNQTSDPQATVTVQVERTGRHHIIIFPITGGRGILDASAKFQMEVMIAREERPLQGTTTIDDVLLSTVMDTQVDTTGPSARTVGIEIGVSLFGIVLVVLFVVLFVVLMLMLRKWRKRKYSLKEESPRAMSLSQPVHDIKLESQPVHEIKLESQPVHKIELESQSVHVDNSGEETSFFGSSKEDLSKDFCENVPHMSSNDAPPSDDLSRADRRSEQQEAWSLTNAADIFPSSSVEMGVPRRRRNAVTLDAPGDRGIVTNYYYKPRQLCQHLMETHVNDNVLSIPHLIVEDFHGLIVCAEPSKKAHARSLSPLPQQETKGTSGNSPYVPSIIGSHTAKH